MNVCQGERKVTLGRMDLMLKCQIGIHRGGDCRMALGDGVIVIFKPTGGK